MLLGNQTLSLSELRETLKEILLFHPAIRMLLLVKDLDSESGISDCDWFMMMLRNYCNSDDIVYTKESNNLSNVELLTSMRCSDRAGMSSNLTPRYWVIINLDEDWKPNQELVVNAMKKRNDKCFLYNKVGDTFELSEHTRWD